LRADPSDPLPKCGLYVCCCRNGDIAQAERCLVDLLEAHPQSENVHVSRCWFYVKLRRRKMAEGAIEAALKLYPQNEELLSAQLYFARCYLSEGDVRGLGMSLLRLYPDNFCAHSSLGEHCLKRNDLAGAEEHFRTCMSVSPSESIARMLRLIEARRTGRGMFSLFLWAIKRKLLKLFVPGYARRERMRIRWSR